MRNPIQVESLTSYKKPLSSRLLVESKPRMKLELSLALYFKVMVKLHRSDIFTVNFEQILHIALLYLLLTLN